MKIRRFFTVLCLTAVALLSGILLFSRLTLAAPAERVAGEGGTAVAQSPHAPTAIIADFEGGGPPDWFQYNGPGSTVSPAFITIGGNGLLSVTFNVTDWGGFGALLPAVDWSNYQAITFEFYGENSGLTYAFELQDGSDPVVERFQAFFTDDFTGKQQITLPFATFVRGGFQDPGAPDNGFQLTDIAAWVFPLPAGNAGFMLDNLAVVEIIPFADFTGGAPAGWFQYNGPGSTVAPDFATISDTDPYALPGQVGDNGILSGTYNVTDWGGFGALLTPAQNWSALDGVALWVYGQNNGAPYTVEIQDGTPGNPVAERFQAVVTDDFSGWRLISLPFADFFRGGFQEPGAPDDGLNLVEMRAWAFPLPATDASIVLDDLAVYGDPSQAELAVAFVQTGFQVTEGNTAVITVTLNMTSSEPATVAYETVDGTAVAGTDYTAASGTLTFPPDTLAQTFTVTTLDNGSADGSRQLSLLLSDPVSVTLGYPHQTTLTILDDEEPNPANTKLVVIDDFELTELVTGTDGTADIGWLTWSAPAASSAITLTQVVSNGTPPPVPGLGITNTVMQLDTTVGSGQWAGFTHAFEDETVTQWLTQDWSRYVGVAFWLYGNNTGGTLFMDILDNRNPGSTSDDAERYSIDIPDNFSGWRYFEIPFTQFNRKEIGNGAPNDGFTLTEIHGYAFGVYGSVPMGAQTNFVDQVAVIVRTTIIDDYELTELVSGMDGTTEIGFVTWNATGASSAITLTQVVTNGTPEPVPGLGTPNTVLQLDTTVGSGQWAGFTHAFEDETVTQWTPQDWSTYEGVCFWLYGNNTGGTLYLDILDNRNPGSTSDDAERYSMDIPDNFSGWRFFAIPFTDFNRKDIGNGAPNDGFTLTEVHGYAIGAYGSVPMGAQTNYVDQVAIYGNTGADTMPRVSFTAANFAVAEGDTAVITVSLNMTHTEPITVPYRTAESHASPVHDYTPTSGLLVFAPGETSHTFTVQTHHNGKAKGDQLVMLILDNPVNAERAFPYRARLNIVETDTADLHLLDDFEGFHRFYDNAGVELTFTEILAGSGMALPNQGPYETVLTINAVANRGGATYLSQSYAEAQDWSAYEGMSVWVYGRNSGETLTLELQDNRANSTATTPADDWVLVWSDEFAGTAGIVPDRNVWRPELGDGTLNGNTGWGNGELQFYTNSPDNAALDGAGNLVITAQEVNTATSNLECYYGPCEYTSARLITSERFEMQYGRVEARLQVPYGQGLWPAFWMLGNDIGTVGWPQSGELDIMENIGREPATVHGTIHGPGYSGCCGVGGSYTLPSGQLSDDFHIFAVEWEPEAIRWYIDGINYFTATINDIPAGTEWVFDHSFFLLMNVAVGGAWPGYPDDTTVFPQTMTVDYVRVYQAADTAERFETSFVDNFNGWRQIFLPFSDFQRSASQPDGAPNDGLTLTEVWGYGFNLPATFSQPLHLDQVRLETTIIPPDNTRIIYLPVVFKP
ncbi:MAG: family 16 glycosylhydrolase [Anaerolineae bacterium]|nr:family 16 glycosylhydrolase [Anaerolineae bacterium]